MNTVNLLRTHACTTLPEISLYAIGATHDFLTAQRSLRSLAFANPERMFLLLVL